MTLRGKMTGVDLIKDEAIAFPNAFLHFIAPLEIGILPEIGLILRTARGGGQGDRVSQP